MSRALSPTLGEHRRLLEGGDAWIESWKELDGGGRGRVLGGGKEAGEEVSRRRKGGNMEREA